ncbi:MAG: ATP-binding protein [Bacteroidia bacterium]
MVCNSKEGNSACESSLILILGISGVGKTSLSVEYAERNSGFRSISASSLIAEKKLGLSPATLDEIRRNQEALVSSVLHQKQDNPGTTLLLDGHAAIETPSGASAIPDDVFDRIQPTAIVLVYDDPVEISARRFLKKKSGNVEHVKNLQILERELSSMHARRIGIPYREVRSGSFGEFSSVIADLTAKAKHS